MVGRAAVLAFFLLVAGGAGALAAEDPPGRVGRLSYLEGDVMFRAAEQDEWSPATLNFPVSSGHSLWTESGGLAEIQVGPAELRLKEQTELDLPSLDDRGQILAIRQGTLALRLRTAASDLRIDTPRGVISFPQPGRYRVDVADDQITATVFEGEAHLEEIQGAHIVRAGESARIFGQPRQIDFARAEMTSFDSWTMARDQATAAPQTLTHVSPHMTGYQDLDRHGTWERAPEYGTVWYPARVVDDWAPYRYGHWAYVEPWGWTWIDDAPWGFAPFHYGRWVRVGHRWAWWPGTYIERPVYAPALVAFIGGDDWSVTISRPSIGWVPLAPYEIYRPHYRTSVTYVRNVNVTVVNKTVIKNISVRHRDHDRDRHVARFKNHGAATVVDSEAFKQRRRVHEARVEVPRERIAEARISDEPRHIKPAVARRDDARTERGPRRERSTARRDEPRAVAAPESKPNAAAAPAPQVQRAPRPERPERAAPQPRERADADRPRRMERETADSVKREPRPVRIETAPEPRVARPDRETERREPARAVPPYRAPDAAPQPQVQREVKPVPAYRQPHSQEPRVARPERQTERREPERDRAIPRYRAPEPPPQPRAMPQPQPQREAAPAPAYRQQATREERRPREERPARGNDEDRRRERKDRG